MKNKFFDFLGWVIRGFKRKQMKFPFKKGECE